MAATSTLGTGEAEEMERRLFISVVTSELLETVMNSQWSSVVYIYKEYPAVRTAKILRSGDTVLHIAVINGLGSTVEELVDCLPVDQKMEILSIENGHGNTPLHLAAALGNVAICRCVAEGVTDDLVGKRNKDGETPLFTAAVHGQKDALLWLYQHSGKNLSVCRRTGDGQTLLLAAIAGEHFELGVIIIDLYPELAFMVNEEGISPLQLMATKPSAFESGSAIRGFNRLIYKCLSVKRVKISIIHQESDLGGDDHNNRRRDEEDPRPQHQAKKQDERNRPPKRSLPKRIHAMINYLVPERKIRQEKQKHVWSLQIVQILLLHVRSYEYQYDGTDPRSSKNGETVPYTVNNGFAVQLNFDCLKEGDDHIKPSKPEERICISGNLVNNVWDFEILRGDTQCLIRPNTDDGKDQMSKRPEPEKKNGKHVAKRETAILIAARNGVVEIVERILSCFPIAAQEVDSEEKNIFLLAAEYRQPKVYDFIRQFAKWEDQTSIFRKVDKDGNSALHLAAKMDPTHPSPWLIPGAALQMQSEILWREHVQSLMPLSFFTWQNKKGQTPDQIFTETHKDLLKDAKDWMNSTSTACSVVATLIATVAFATSATIPGDWDDGAPKQKNNPVFIAFACCSIVAVWSSFASIVLFLSILTSRNQEQDFRKTLPRRLLVGLSCLFVSLNVMLVSFCASHFFSIKDKMRVFGAVPFYFVTCTIVISYCIYQFPWYFDLLLASQVPERSYN